MNFPISELRIVYVYMAGPIERRRIREGELASHVPSQPSVRMMNFVEVPTFVEATIRLHHTHGNPHHKNDDGTPKPCPLDNLWKIEVARLNMITQSYWWCSPTLHESPDGAQLNQEEITRERLFAHPYLLQLEAEGREAEERWEMENP
jgi:hypothetical protein